MNFSNRFFHSACIGLFIYGLQLIAIFWLYPTPKDFVPIKTYEGTFTYEANFRSSSQTFLRSIVDGSLKSNEISCGTNYFGSLRPCLEKSFGGKQATAYVTQLPSLFGDKEVVFKLVVDRSAVVDRSGDQLSHEWVSSSLFNATLWSFICAVIYSGYLGYKKNKKIQK